MNKITLIIAIYNRTDYLKRAIDSIYNVGFDNIILVNDGSNEIKTLAIKNILEDYPKIKYIEHKENLGLGEAKNTGIAASNTTWITFLDDDDYYLKNPINDLKEFISNNQDADIIHYKIRLKKKETTLDWGYEKFTLNELIQYNRLTGVSLFKKEVWNKLGGFKQIPYEDWEFWIRAKQANFNFVYYPDIFYIREFIEDSLQCNTEKAITDIDWKIKYLGYDTIKNSFNKDIGIGISTFLRDDSLFRLINSNLKFLQEFKMYIIDQGNKNWKKELFYDKLRSMGHVIKYIPYDSGISKSRWVLKNICQEPYLVFMEDDFEANYSTNLYKLQEILEENNDIGVVGGNLKGNPKIGSYSFFLDYADDKICYFPLDYLVEKNLTQWKQTSKGTRFIEASIVSDFTMWKKEVPNIFDENVKTIEHTHVYLLIKYKTNYKVAFCPESEIKHCHDVNSKDYNNFRNRKADFDYLKKYWNIVDFYKFDKHKLIKLEKIDTTSTQKITPIEPVKVTDVQPKKEEPIIPITNLSTNYSPEQIFKILNLNGIDYILIKQSCLQLINKKEIDCIQIAVTSEKEIDKINKLFPNNHFQIEIKSNIRKIKNSSYKNISLKVPFPVVQYLEKTFKKRWEELKNE